MSQRCMPIMWPKGSPPVVPWPMIAAHEQQAQRNHGQSLARLAQRGGLDADEALAVLEDRPYRAIPLDRAAARLREMIAAWNDSGNKPERCGEEG